MVKVRDHCQQRAIEMSGDRNNAELPSHQGAAVSAAIGFRTLLVLLLMNAALLSLWSAGLAPRLAAEDGILETLQLLLAASAFGAFLFTALADDGPIGTSGTANAAICAIAAVREIDVRHIVVPDWMMLWSVGNFRDTTVAVLLLLVIGYTWLRREHFRGWLRLLLRMAAWPYWLAGILLTSSLAFDGEKIVAGPAGVLIEEFIELNGFLLLFIAGLRHANLLTVRGRIEL
jgi:hypothetical protein